MNRLNLIEGLNNKIYIFVLIKSKAAVHTYAVRSMASLILFLCTGNILAGFKFSEIVYLRSHRKKGTNKKGKKNLKY